MSTSGGEGSYGARLARIYDLNYSGMGKDYAAEARQVRTMVEIGRASCRERV